MARPALVETEELVAAKILARKQAMAARKVAKADAGPDAGQKLADHFQTLISPPAGTIISGFLSIGSEVDVAPTLSAMAGRGCQICLPCVIAPRTPLVFRLWKQGDALIEESFGTRAPAATATEVQPDILIVPLLDIAWAMAVDFMIARWRCCARPSLSWRLVLLIPGNRLMPCCAAPMTSRWIGYSWNQADFSPIEKVLSDEIDVSGRYCRQGGA